MARTPLKAQTVADVVGHRIAVGEILSGAWLPSERQFADEYGIDRSTVRRVIRLLVERDLIEMYPGIGSRVRPAAAIVREAVDVTRQTGAWRGFHVSATQAGGAPYTRTTIHDGMADPVIARWLAVPVGTQIMLRTRLQGVGEEPPIQLSTSWIPPATIARFEVLREIDTGAGGMYSRFEEAGHALRFEETVTCRLPRADEQVTLAIGSQQPVFAMWRRCFDQNERILEVTHRVVVGSRQELVYRYDARS